MDTRLAYARATCYCKDCRAFTRFVGAQDVLDASGGVDIVATAPSSVRFTSGAGHIACMSLGPKGLLRWYTACCRTPLATTPRDPKLPYAGMMTACFDAAPGMVEATLGRRDRIVLNTDSATAPVRATPLTFVTGGLRIFAGILRTRLRGDRGSPFFDASGHPLCEPEVISREQRVELERADRERDAA